MAKARWVATVARAAVERAVATAGMESLAGFGVAVVTVARAAAGVAVEESAAAATEEVAAVAVA